MRKAVFLLAIVAVAVSPSLASAKAKPHAKAAKVEKPAAGPNDNTFRLFENMFK